MQVSKRGNRSVTQRRDQACTFQRPSVLSQNIFSCQKWWWSTPSFRSKPSKQIYPDRTFQNGKSHDNKIPHKQGGLYDKYRSDRCISNRSYTSNLAEISFLPMARNVLPIRNNAVWSECCTESVYKIDEASNSLAARSGCSNDYFSRRYTRASPINRNIKPTHTYDYKSTGIIRVSDQLQKVNTNTHAEDLFLGMLIDSTTMEFILPKEKSENILRECRHLLKTHQPSIRQISRVLGLLEFTRPAIWSAPLHYRHIQLVQIESLHQTSDYNTQVNLSKKAKLDLIWWITNLPSLGGSPILPLTADLTISSDASKIGWGASWGKFRTGGRWYTHEPQGHINILELKAAFFALKSFAKDQINKVICLKIDNSTAVAYLNNKGGTHSHQLLQLTLEIWHWCETKRLYLLAQHVPGKNNVVADEESRKMRDHNDWKIDSTVIRQFIKKCQIDLFASRLTRQLNRYVSWRPDPGAIHVDAFTMNWTNLNAYAFPPFN